LEGKNDTLDTGTSLDTIEDTPLPLRRETLPAAPKPVVPAFKKFTTSPTL